MAVGLFYLSDDLFGAWGPAGRYVEWAWAQVTGDTDKDKWKPRTFQCRSKPLPEFTLGYRSNPSDAQIDALCKCVWGKLDVQARSIFRGSYSPPNKGQARAAAQRAVDQLRGAMQACGALGM
jgi:hypothetical protein